MDSRRCGASFRFSAGWKRKKQYWKVLSGRNVSRQGGGGFGEVGKVRGRGGVSRQAEEGLVRLGRCWTELPFLAGFLEKIFKRVLSRGNVSR